MRPVLSDREGAAGPGDWPSRAAQHRSGAAREVRPRVHLGDYEVECTAGVGVAAGAGDALTGEVGAAVGGAAAADPGAPVAAGTGALGTATGFAPAPSTLTAVVVAGAIVTCVVMAAFCCAPLVPRAARVALALRADAVLVAGDMTGFLRGDRPKSASTSSCVEYAASSTCLAAESSGLSCAAAVWSVCTMLCQFAAAEDTALAWAMRA